MENLRKKISIIGVVVLAATLIAVAGVIASNHSKANADNDYYASPYPPRVAYMNGFTASIVDIPPELYYWLRLDASTHVATNCVPASRSLANFYLHFVGGGTEWPAGKMVTLNCGYDDPSKVAGQTCHVYIEYEDGTSEILQVTFDDQGNVTFPMKKTGYISLVTEFNPPTPGPDQGDKSPKTGRF